MSVAALGLAVLAQVGLEARALGPEEVSAMAMAMLCSAGVALAIRKEIRVQSSAQRASGVVRMHQHDCLSDRTGQSGCAEC